MTFSPQPPDFDVSLYIHSPDRYLALQSLRPDYVKAIQLTTDIAVAKLQNSPTRTILDLCCGVGSNTARIAMRLNECQRAVLVDINQSLLAIAAQTIVGVQRPLYIGDDVLQVVLEERFKVILSIFAYHHMPDDKKKFYLARVKDRLDPDGIFLLTEIYSPDDATTKRYYDRLLQEIPESSRNEDLTNFLQETAQSKNFEFKVSKSFADYQLAGAGFELLHSTKIWPSDTALGEEVGTFVEVYTLK